MGHITQCSDEWARRMERVAACGAITRSRRHQSTASVVENATSEQRMLDLSMFTTKNVCTRNVREALVCAAARRCVAHKARCVDALVARPCAVSHAADATSWLGDQVGRVETGRDRCDAVMST